MTNRDFLVRLVTTGYYYAYHMDCYITAKIVHFCDKFIIKKRGDLLWKTN